MSSSSQAASWPPGWYEDAGRSGRGRRYWNGTAWTERFEYPEGGAPLAPSFAPAPPAAAQPVGAMTVQQTVINVGSQKSVVGAVLLALFFGPLGMLYATVPGGLVMFVVNVLVAIPTLGLGLLVTIPIGALWAGQAASSQNRRVGGSSQIVQAPATPAAAPPGWHADPIGSGRLRYWDGSGWTNEYSDPARGPNGHALPGATPTADASPVAALPAQSSGTHLAGTARDRLAFCDSCGAGVQPSDQFCPGCGHRQAAAVQPSQVRI
jgi:hypothetical protein